MFDEFEGSKIESKINSKMEFLDISIGRPLLLEDYQLNSNVKSFVILINFKAENENIIMSAVLNVLIVKNRLIFMAYYDKYSNYNQIKKLKAKNDYFALSLFSVN